MNFRDFLNFSEISISKFPPDYGGQNWHFLDVCRMLFPVHGMGQRQGRRSFFRCLRGEFCNLFPLSSSFVPLLPAFSMQYLSLSLSTLSNSLSIFTIDGFLSCLSFVPLAARWSEVMEMRRKMETEIKWDGAAAIMAS